MFGPQLQTEFKIFPLSLLRPKQIIARWAMKGCLTLQALIAKPHPAKWFAEFLWEFYSWIFLFHIILVQLLGQRQIL